MPQDSPCSYQRITMPLTLLLLVVGLLTLQCCSAQSQGHQNITKRSDRRFYDGAIYIHPPYDSSSSFHPKFRNERHFSRGQNSFFPQTQSRQNGFSYCNGGGKCQFFLYCWLSGGSLGPSCGPLFSCCITGNEPQSKAAAPAQRSYGPVKNDPYCGRSATRTSRIVGGNDAYFGQFPWQAVIQVGGSRCGGALVGRRFVVTAGHCVARSQHKPHNIRVTLGDYVLHSNVESLPAEVFGVSEVRLHPNFRFTPQADRYDVAVVVLDRPVPYRENIRPICIPRKGADFLGRTAYAAGWGALEPGSKLRPKVLQFVSVPVINNKICENWHRKQGINIRIHDEMMCAGYEFGGKDACQGDSGGPLMMEENNVWFLIGIVSAGYSCAKQYQPGIYHKVSSSADWVSSAMH
ncbi:testisin-like [Argiope bruennichi]|uniref:Testisin like protein n=1 Tax=Argiope bruennichi TaxID=94029 RepID=A0A8T0DZQ5_ARGBR|nr:testisin-like [Argiope bruennichi]KAF8763942.1 Testisin like protein [Argiope bruennichi]